MVASWRCCVAPHSWLLLALLLLLGQGKIAQGRRRPHTTQAQEYLYLNTEYGDIVVALLSKDAPRTVRLVKRIARARLYDGAVFYRAEPGFVVQGGLREPSGATRPNPYAPVPLEANTPNLRGTVTMARFKEPNSGSGEFFINLADSKHLDPQPDGQGYGAGFAVFGRVVSGMDVAEAISRLPTQTQDGSQILMKGVLFSASVNKSS